MADLLTDLVNAAVKHSENITLQNSSRKRTFHPFSDIPTSRAELDRLRKEAALRNYIEFEPLVPVYQPIMSIPMEQESTWSLLKTRLSQKMQSVTSLVNSVKGEVADHSPKIATSEKPTGPIKKPFPPLPP